MAKIGGANRIELESQILCAALRQSWVDTDATGMVKSCQELYMLYPDLLPPPTSDQVIKPSNYYDILEIGYDVRPSMILAAYFKATKRFLREHKTPRDLKKNNYLTLLNAGFILRRPRSRLSHDLIIARSILVEDRIIPEDGTLEMIHAPLVVQPATAEQAAEPATVEATEAIESPAAPAVELAAETVAEPAVEPAAETVGELEPAAETAVEPAAESAAEDTTQPLQEVVPMLIELLQYAKFIDSAEVQALKNQTRLYPDIPLTELVLHAGYISFPELKSIVLAEYLISSGKITLEQFRVILDEKRTWTSLFLPQQDSLAPSAIQHIGGEDRE